MRRLILFILYFACLPLQPAYAEGAEQPSSLTWHQLAAAGQPEQAFEVLRKDPNISKETADYYYNLGTLSVQAGQVARGIAYLEKSLSLNPSFKDAEKNLRIADRLWSQQNSGRLRDPATLTTEWLAESWGILILQWAMAGMAAFAGFQWGVRRKKDRSTRIQWLVGVGLFLGCVTVRWMGAGTVPVVAVDPLTVRSGPGNQNIDLGSFPAGIRFRWLGKQMVPDETHPDDAWLQVRFNEESIGWLPVRAVLLLNDRSST